MKWADPSPQFPLVYLGDEGSSFLDGELVASVDGGFSFDEGVVYGLELLVRDGRHDDKVVEGVGAEREVVEV